MKDKPTSLRMILKFDTGADGFLKMIYVLAVCAVITLGLGLFFLIVYWPHIHTPF